MSYLTDIIKQDDINITELDYRVSRIAPNKNITKLSLVEKYQLLGKIGSKPTRFDINSYYNNSVLSYHKNKIWFKKREEFSTCRANNCLVSGKWCYEVVLLSNGLFQIGFGQLTTPNTSVNGIGDDKTSFGFDGYRKVIYHNQPLSYGNIWDTGDVLGVCIDLTNKRLEYFLNGVSLGFVYQGVVQCGKNIAYFPAVSGAIEEKALFNFGEVPFYYNYKGYEPIDITKSTYNNSLNTSAKLLKILEYSLLDLLCNSERTIISELENRALNKIVFSYIINVSFDDLFISKELFFPFLANLLKENEDKFNQFILQIEYYFRYINKSQRKRFYSKLMGRLCNLAEEYSLLGAVKKKKWETIMELIINLVCNKYIFKKWLKSPKISFHLSLLFNSNTVHMNKIYETILIQSKANKFSRSKQLKNLILNSSAFYPESSMRNEEIYSKTISKFLFAFILMNKKLESLPSCFNILFRTMKGYYHLELISKCQIETLVLPECKPVANVIKNFIYNYMQMFYDNYSNMPFDKLEKDPFVFNILKSIIHMLPFINSYFIAFNAYYKYAKALPDIGWKFNQETSTLRLESIYRNFFNFFNDYSQRVLYQFSFYISQYLLYCVKRIELNDNHNGVLFPGIIAHSLYKYYSKILKEDSISKQLCSKCTLDSNMSYIESIVSLYCEVLPNSLMASHKDQAKLIMKYLGFILKKPFFTNVLFNNKEISQKLIEMIIFYISDINYSDSICNIIGKVMVVSNRRYLNKLNSALKRIPEKTISSFTLFCLNYVEEKMNKYILNFDSVKTKGYEQYDYIHLMWHKRGYSAFCNALNVYSFAILLNDTDPSQSLNSFGSIIFIKFKIILINITTRLLNKPSLEEFRKLKERYLIYHHKPHGLSLLKLLIAISGLFASVYSNKEALDKLEQQIAVNDSLEIASLNYLLIHYMSKDDDNNAYGNKAHNDEMASYGYLRNFSDMMKRITEKRAIEVIKRELEKEEKKNDGYDGNISEEDVCILCFSNKSNKMILPCRHSACNDCIVLYIQDKKCCFICRGIVLDIIDKL